MKKWQKAFSPYMIVVVVLLAVVMMLPNDFNAKKTEAISTTDTSSFVSVGEIWNGSNRFVAANFDKMLAYITGNADATLATVTNSVKSAGAINATTIRQKTLSGVLNKTSSQSVVVRFAGLDWIVTYLSTNTSGDIIATLWLDNNIQDEFINNTSKYTTTSGEYYGYTNGGLFGDWNLWMNDEYSSTGYPSNLYSTSYIRASLNNGSQYSSARNSSTLVTVPQNENHAFAKFTMSQFNITQFLERPKNMSWQQNTADGSVPENANDFLNSDNPNQTNFCNKVGLSKYSEWGNDYVWLPSLTETGYIDADGGLWGLSNSERANYDGTTATVSNSVGSASRVATPGTETWTRSAAYEWASVCYYNSAYAYQLNVNGGSYSHSYVSSYSNGGYTSAIRPCIHLNLTKANNKGIDYNITLATNDENMGTVAGGGTFLREYGIITIVATPKTGYMLDYWKDSNDTILSENKSYSFSTLNSLSFTAVFRESYRMSGVSNDTSMGTVSGGKLFDKSFAGSITLTAVAQSGYMLDYWTNASGAIMSYNNAFTYSPRRETVVFTAVFRPLYLVTAVSNDASMGTVTGGVQFDKSFTGTVTLTASPSKYHILEYWQNDKGEIVSHDNIYVASPRGDMVYTAVFRAFKVNFITANNGAEIVEKLEDKGAFSEEYLLKFASGKYLTTITVNNQLITLKYINGTVTNIPNCSFVEYTVKSDGTELHIKFIEKLNDIDVTLGFSINPVGYFAAGGNSVETVAVVATMGGSATILGFDVENPEEITLVAKLMNGYSFLGWFIGESKVAYSTNMSIRIPYSDVEGCVVTAKFDASNNKNLNLQLHNE